MQSNGCSDDPLYMETLLIIAEKEPNIGMYKKLATVAVKDKKWDEAIDWYEKIIEMSNDSKEKAEYQMKIANIQVSLGQKSKARASAKKAMSYDSYVAGQAYSLIGNLYLFSYKECKGGNPVKDRLVYLAAYEQYKKAGNKSGMEKAQAQFPSKTEMFTLGLKEGQTMSTGCWVGETVTLRARP
jgi:tetratricopeptide (TPR) repeat protein